MSLCPICGRYLCDHTPDERDQTFDQMMRPASEEEQKAWQDNPSDSPNKIAAAQKHAQDPV